MPEALKGLTSGEAQNRLQAEGYNELPHAGHRSLLRIALEVIREPMFGLLIGSGIVYLLLGDLTEALLLLAFASISVAIAIVQASRSERVLEALRDLTSPRALVIRDGERRRISGREVVRGDFIVLGEGDRVPADAQLIQANDMQVDESLLTGESVPVRKIVANNENHAMPPMRPGGDDLPFVFSGTLVVRGEGLAEVHATGLRSEIGKIGQALETIDSVPPRLTQETRRLVRAFGLFGLICCVLAVMLYGLLRGSWLDALLAGIALGMSMLPEEFPLVLTVFTVMGAWRISRARVLTRRASTIETLGAATVLCTDKTGTLTENRMTITALVADGETFHLAPQRAPPLPEKFQQLVDCGRLASAREPFDPMDKAFHALSTPHADAKEELVHSYGLRPELLAVTQVWQITGMEGCRVAAKGAPEAIAALCHFDAAALAALVSKVNRLAADGMRVLAVANASFHGQNWPASPQAFAFTFVGLVGLADPLRPSVPDAVRECRSAGIRVIMITGDYPATALAIAHAAGLTTDTVLTGDDIEAMSDAELSQHTLSVSVFARIMPAQKLRIVRALKADGEVVAMTGDGVNDAPSLKAADIGIAMGGRGTDVAREAAALVLLDDDFGSIVKTVRLGRRIYDNLQKAMGYILAIHIPIAGLALLPLVMGLPLIFMPIHIAFLEMVIDPVCSIVFEAEAEEQDIMQRRPRAATSRLFSSRFILWSLLQGVLAFGTLAALYLLALQRGMPDNEVRALTFVSLVLVNLGLVLVNRSFSSSLGNALRWNNRALWWVSVVALSLLGLILAWEPARGLFRFGPLHADDLIVTLAATGGLLVVLEILKRFWRQRDTG
ncbi:ATPase [Rugosibacter aromaticivorans]|uniref:ATPase n=1 Tax=Rugosibacter aromaticivorans TaxID=1565605 RepID=A0A0C5J7M8_9PROT|nr:cation-translocating P-type ATPase [Rugosibacter aromaticivorans]AJP47619.1 ATPase [Rugosibacter aromaticivorans]